MDHQLARLLLPIIFLMASQGQLSGPENFLHSGSLPFYMEAPQKPSELLHRARVSAELVLSGPEEAQAKESSCPYQAPTGVPWGLQAFHRLENGALKRNSIRLPESREQILIQPHF